jgi:hypothetical protein
LEEAFLNRYQCGFSFPCWGTDNNKVFRQVAYRNKGLGVAGGANFSIYITNVAKMIYSKFQNNFDGSYQEELKTTNVECSE